MLTYVNEALSNENSLKSTSAWKTVFLPVSCLKWLIISDLTDAGLCCLRRLLSCVELSWWWFEMETTCYSTVVLSFGFEVRCFVPENTS